MAFITRGGSADVTIPAGQYLVVGSVGAGTSKVSLSASTIAPNSLFIFAGQVTGGYLTLGTYSTPQIARIEASTACDIEYSVSATPTLGVSKAFANGLTAKAGGGQSGATLLSAELNRVTTVATAADSCLLGSAVPGATVWVVNAASANAMNVFPATGESINALAANTALSVAANKVIVFTCAVAGVWNSLLTA
jgi:hypothetical protein